MDKKRRNPMKTRSPAGRVLLLAGACALALGGCIVAPAPGYYSDGPVYVDPPPPRYEAIGAAPHRGYVWIDGYWGWSGRRHDWVPGRWAPPPHPGQRWVPHRWDREGSHWRMRPGRWD
jgi:hypothetical protein